MGEYLSPPDIDQSARLFPINASRYPERTVIMNVNPSGGVRVYHEGEEWKFTDGWARFDSISDSVWQATFDGMRGTIEFDDAGEASFQMNGHVLAFTDYDKVFGGDREHPVLSADLYRLPLTSADKKVLGGSTNQTVNVKENGRRLSAAVSVLIFGSQQYFTHPRQYDPQPTSSR